nr:protein amalgam-like [Penaeus vannamei]
MAGMETKNQDEAANKVYESICGGLSYFILGKDAVPEFATTLQNLTVAAGREARLSCVVENLGMHKVAWTHYGWHGRAVLTVDNNVITKNHRVSVLQEGGGAAWTLIIANVSTTDQGTYMCQINTVPPVKRYGHIKVVVPPTITEPPSDVTVSEGDDVTLKCGATGDPEPVLTWRREDGAAFTLNNTQVLEAAGSQLALSSVTREDTGAFLCVSSNGIPPAVSARAQVFVKYRPEIIGGSGVVWAEIATKATLECRYRAWPRPKVIWTRNGVVMGGAVESVHANGYGTSILVLNTIETDSFGHYHCTVSNELGENTTTLTLIDGMALEKKTSFISPATSSSSSWQRPTNSPGPSGTDAPLTLRAGCRPAQRPPPAAAPGKAFRGAKNIKKRNYSKGPTFPMLSREQHLSRRATLPAAADGRPPLFDIYSAWPLSPRLLLDEALPGIALVAVCVVIHCSTEVSKVLGYPWPQKQGKEKTLTYEVKRCKTPGSVHCPGDS